VRIIKSFNFDMWLKKLKDIKTKQIILKRINRLYDNNFGNSKYLKDGVYELKIKYGGGYRVYFANRNDEIILLLMGGNKSRQKVDIQKAIKINKEYENE
jgi:putative addiction module killer protein